MWPLWWKGGIEKKWNAFHCEWKSFRRVWKFLFPLFIRKVTHQENMKLITNRRGLTDTLVPDSKVALWEPTEHVRFTRRKYVFHVTSENRQKSVFPRCLCAYFNLSREIGLLSASYVEEGGGGGCTSNHEALGVNFSRRSLSPSARESCLEFEMKSASVCFIPFRRAFKIALSMSSPSSSTLNIVICEKAVLGRMRKSRHARDVRLSRPASDVRRFSSLFVGWGLLDRLTKRSLSQQYKSCGFRVTGVQRQTPPRLGRSYLVSRTL